VEKFRGKPIAHICNKSLKIGESPDCLKYSVINPLFKKRKKSESTNYRPISLLNGLQRFFNYRFMEDLTSISKIALYLFQNNMAQKLTEIILNAWNNNRYIACVYCDLTKACDCVNHELLLKKLQFYGVKGILLDWFKSHLYTRKWRV
jgi:hypothetical protein